MKDGSAAWKMAGPLAVLACALPFSGCDSTRRDNADLVWAVNVGGPAYQGSDGTRYVVERSVSGGSIGNLSRIRGSQDELIYRSYRHGDITVAHPLADGLYDVTLHFAEPDQIAPTERLFDVIIESQQRIDDLDVLVARDGKIHSALTVTVPNVSIADAELNIEFQASAGEPVLSGIVVRNKNRPRRSWRLVWRDEFDDEGAPDPERWNVEEWPPRVVNSEDQAYTARSRNVRVEDGMLVIEAHKERYGEAEYTSARIQSAGKGDLRYGRIEARARVPGGLGTWAAVWMLPTDPYFYSTSCADGEFPHGNESCDAWPNSGEIDIMEYVGYQKNHIHGTVHNRAYYYKHWNQRKGRIILDDAEDDFHVYALEWTPERIDVFVDDSLYFTYVNEGGGWQSWPYDKPFHLILNLAIGGDWGRSGGGIDDTIFPCRLLVDYVRVYGPEPADSGLRRDNGPS